ncbi:hypothetical protein AVEN_157637-1 [Araneus ventricosus]|uniref:Uncharacterized protein n=1 Tax=Araneus ventricosus TaxID=182803 RepID=A0A4Y2JKN5_ARAVE|nr:hypothetical protein AVEN_157637-1 [Araneus ventricosus]
MVEDESDRSEIIIPKRGEGLERIAKRDRSYDSLQNRCCLLLPPSESLLPSDDLPEKLLHDVGESEHGDSQPAAKKSAHVTEDFAALRK